ncbi:MAG TPA: BTAD domain-containing putative transcriptional regulator, partial [Actinopolymorphaceae bacterium]|nr:BTAD domain-containing putative transcriptional regulator [Actinopolymorphaceae bacterium]
MQVSVLGPLEVRDDHGRPLEVGGSRLRALLVRLALEPGRVVTVDALIDSLWGQAPPSGAVNALQSLVSRLRRVFADGKEPGSAGVVESRSIGYRLCVEPNQVDAHRFERLAATGRRALAAGRAVEASTLLREAESLWRGPALADLADAPFAPVAATRLDELRLAATEDRVDADLTLARHADVLAELEPLAAAHPLRERLQGQLIRSLYASGRQSDASRVLPATELAGRLPLSGSDGSDPAAGPDGLWLVELAGVTNSHDVVQAVLSAVGVREAALPERTPMEPPPPRRDAMTMLVEALAHRRALLLLDNCEHVVDAAARLADSVLAACPSLRILATSREPLAVAGEVLYTIPPLAWPPVVEPPVLSTAGVVGPPARSSAAGTVHGQQSARPAPSDILTYPAVRLFADRAAAVDPDFDVLAGNGSAVVEICRRLDGMPLAIELAAVKVRALSVTQIAARLDDRFRLLTGGSRTALARHQTLRAVIEWSWELLDEPERILARRLAVFPGGVTVEAAEQICADGGAGPVPLPAYDVLGTLGALVDKSLLETVVDDGTGDGVRYRMLETVRAYAAERLDEAGETDRLHAAHAGYFTVLAETAEPLLRSASQLEWMARLRAEQGNLLAALRWAIDSRNADIGVRLCAAILWFWFIHGNRTESIALVDEVLL